MASSSSSSSSVTLLTAMQSSILHKQIVVELLNDVRITGRVVQFDAENMNVKLDNLTETTAVRRSVDGTTTAASDVVVVHNPPQLPAMHSITIRGSSIRSLELTDDHSAAIVERAIQRVRAGGLAEL